MVLQYKHLQLYQESIKGFVYSVKLKLELNILSKLVDLVQQPGSVDRSMNWEIIDVNSIAGQAQAAVRRESLTPEKAGVWPSSGEKGADKSPKDVFATEAAESTSQPASHNDVDSITHVVSQRSRFSARTASRESDILYAEVLRSLR